MGRPSAIIVGAGVAGLACALHLQEAGHTPLVLEASDEVGGRLRTDEVEGFRLDRGFHILQTGDPEVRRIIDVRRLEPGAFAPGVAVRYRRKLRRVKDPRRGLATSLLQAFSPVLSMLDKIRLRSLGRLLDSLSVDRVLMRPDRTTDEALRINFSKRCVERLFRPLIGGRMLDPALETTSRQCELLLRSQGRGEAVLPAEGMGAIPRQMAMRLPEDAVRTGARVAAIAPGCVTLDSGETLETDTVVLAVAGPPAARLHEGIADPGSRSAICVYFATESPPVKEPVLVLDGDGTGPVNHLAVPSLVSRSYAPEGSHLVSATVIGPREEDDDALLTLVRKQMTEWFGADVETWRHLRTYRIAHALPIRRVGDLGFPPRPVCLDRGLFACGDHLEYPSIDGALASGHRAAEAIMAAE